MRSRKPVQAKIANTDGCRKMDHRPGFSDRHMKDYKFPAGGLDHIDGDQTNEAQHQNELIGGSPSSKIHASRSKGRGDLAIAEIHRGQPPFDVTNLSGAISTSARDAYNHPTHIESRIAGVASRRTRPQSKRIVSKVGNNENQSTSCISPVKRSQAGHTGNQSTSSTAAKHSPANQADNIHSAAGNSSVSISKRLSRRKHAPRTSIQERSQRKRCGKRIIQQKKTALWEMAHHPSSSTFREDYTLDVLKNDFYTNARHVHRPKSADPTLGTSAFRYRRPICRPSLNRADEGKSMAVALTMGVQSDAPKFGRRVFPGRIMQTEMGSTGVSNVGALSRVKNYESSRRPCTARNASQFSFADM